jgi:hypothetical protein
MIVKVIVKGALEKSVSQNQVEVNIQEGAKLGKVEEVLKKNWYTRTYTDFYCG